MIDDTASHLPYRLLDEAKMALLSLANNDLDEAAFRVGNIHALADAAGLEALQRAADQARVQLQRGHSANDPQVKAALRHLLRQMDGNGARSLPD